MRHRELVLDNQQAVQKGLCLKVKGVTDIVFRSGQFSGVMREHTAKYGQRIGLMPALEGSGQRRKGVARHQALPGLEVKRGIVLEAVIVGSPEITPRIARK